MWRLFATRRFTFVVGFDRIWTRRYQCFFLGRFAILPAWILLGQSSSVRFNLMNMESVLASKRHLNCSSLSLWICLQMCREKVPADEGVCVREDLCPTHKSNNDFDLPCLPSHSSSQRHQHRPSSNLLSSCMFYYMCIH